MTRQGWCLVVLAVAAVLAGCGGDDGSGRTVKPVEVTTPSGETVTCVLYTGVGIDCDWEDRAP